MLKKVKEILDKRSKINDEDDYRIEKCRDELIDTLSQDELLTIDILNQLKKVNTQIEERKQSADHPILWNVPETNYLKLYIFQII